MQGTLKWGTLKNYHTTAKYIGMFLQTKHKRKDIPLADLNYPFIADFEYFLRKHKPTDHQRPIGNNAVMKHLERFRKMVTMAVRMEWLDKDPFAAFKLHFKKVEREFLTEADLAAIEKKAFKIERLCFVRDLFVFACYTGLSYIDAINLTPHNIQIGIDGMSWIVTQREKTSTPVRIPILSKAEYLIGKYREHPASINSGTLFPKISNQKLNSYLKTTQVYAKVIEKKISNDMSQLEEKLSQIKVCDRKIM
ncbi:MAG: site-specific integrase [Draconibacterium sp.]